MSTIYHCNHCEPQCFINCEKTPSRCGSTELGCIRSILKNSSMENSTDYALDNDVSVEWIEPTPSLGNPQYLSSSTNHQLCLSQCNSSSEEGVYKCIIKGSNVTETLQFTYSVYKINSTSTCSGNNYITITSSSSSYRTFQVSKTITLLSTETTATSIIMAKTTETITTTMVNNSSLVTSFSLHSTTCSSSSVNDQDSTIPYYGGIGLLAITNLLTLILLVTSCVYIIHSKKQTK